STGPDVRAAVIDVGTPDVIVSADLVDSHQTADRDTGIVVRYVDEDAFLLVTVQSSRSVLRQNARIEKVEEGTRTILVSHAIPEALQLTGSGRLTVRLAGRYIGVLVEGVPIFRYELADG